MKERGIDPKTDPEKAGRMWIDTIWHGIPIIRRGHRVMLGKAWSWDKIPWVRDQWKQISNGRPFLVKGIQCVEDAVKAVEYQCDGIVVSNHAGRQVDGAVGSLDMLSEIVDAVGDKLTVLFDSGVRSGITHTNVGVECRGGCVQGARAGGKGRLCGQDVDLGVEY